MREGQISRPISIGLFSLYCAGSLIFLTCKLGKPVPKKSTENSPSPTPCIAMQQTSLQGGIPVDTLEQSLTDDDILVIRTVIAESGHQPYAGQCGVAQVIYDRINYPTTAFGGHDATAVVYRGGQFATPYSGDIYAYPNAIKAVEEVFHKGFRQFDQVTTYFFNPATSGKDAIRWLRTHKYVDTIGNHEFRGDK